MKKISLLILSTFFITGIFAQSYGTFQRSIQRLETRMDNATKAYSELCGIIGERRNEINSDVNSLTWYDKNIASLGREIKQLIEEGNYGVAYRKAVEYKGKIACNSELIARIKTTKQYKEAVKSIKERQDLTEKEKTDWLKKYPYVFVPMLSSSGEVIGGYDWEQVGGPNKSRVWFPSRRY